MNRTAAYIWRMILPWSMAALLILVSCLMVAVFTPSIARAAGIKVVPSSDRVSPGETFYTDIEVENIPSEGLGAIQFRLNVDAPGGTVAGVSDLSQSRDADVSVVTPLTIGLSSEGRSGLKEFFWNGRGSHGILVMDNEPLSVGSALYTFGHTNGAEPPYGSGTVARFYFAVGENVEADEIHVTLTEVVLLDSGEVYTLESNIGATIALRCSVTMPDLEGLTLAEATGALEGAGLVLGDVSEVENHDGSKPLNQVLSQSEEAGSEVQCDTSIDIAINAAPEEVTDLGYTDEAGDESGAVLLSWTPSASDDASGYRVYRVAGTNELLAELADASATEVEISGLTNGQQSQLLVTAVDTFGNESAGVQVTVEPVDDVAPRVVIFGVEEGAYYSSDVTPSIDVEDASATTVSASLNNAPYAGAAISSDGEYTFAVTVFDAAGNATSITINFVIDTASPVIAVTGMEDGKYYNTDLAPAISVDDANLLNVDVLLNGEPYASGTNIAAEADYELYVEAEDKAGNKASGTYVFHIDKTNPASAASIGAPKYESGGEVFLSGDTLITLSSSDAGVVSSGVARIEYRVGDESWAIYSQPFSLAGRTDGIMQVDYRAVDVAGNIEDQNTVTVSLDNTPPEIQLGVGEPVYQDETMLYVTSEAVFTLSASDNLAGIQATEYRIDGGEWTPDAQFTISSEGGHNIGYRSTDNIGNTKEETLDVIVDNTSPESMITIGEPKYQDADTLFVTSSAIFTIESGDAGSGVAGVEYRLDGEAWQSYAPFNVGSEGQHIVYYRATDSLGNVEPEKIIQIVVDNTTPETSMAVGEPKYESGNALYVTGATAFTLTASDDYSGVNSTEYSIDGGEWTPYEPFTIGDEGEHVISYRSTDNLGNVEAEKTLAVTMDNTPPASQLGVGEPKYQGQTTLYVTSETVFALSATDEMSGVKSTEYSIDGGAWLPSEPFTLNPEGGHTIEYRATDNLGNVELARTLQVVVDNTSPETLIYVGQPKHQDNGMLLVTSETVFTLDANDELAGVKSTEYKINDGEWTLYEPFALDGEGEHEIRFRSHDNLGNRETTKKLVVSVDNTQPTTEIFVGEPQYEDETGFYVTSETVFTLEASDNLAGIYMTEYRVDDSEWITYEPFVIAEEGEHTIGYRTTDNLGNAEAEKAVVVVVDNTAPETLISVGDPKYQGGSLYVMGATLFALTAEDNLSGVQTTEYRIDDGLWQPYAPFALEGIDGTHAIGFRSTDNVGNVEEEKVLAVVLDNTPPEAEISVGEPKYQGEESLYVTSESIFTLSAEDNLSGVLSTEYSVDGGDWILYEQFTIEDEGEHAIGYRSTDNLGNMMEETFEVVVDNTPPETSIGFGQSHQDGDTTLVPRETTVSLYAEDSLSGVKETYYRFDDEGTWHEYSEPFGLSSLTYGNHVLHYYSKDNVENTESEKQIAVMVIGVDVSVEVINVPRVLIWTDDSIRSQQKIDFIDGALEGIYHTTVTDKEAFIEAFRSGIYNIVAIMKEDTPLNAGMMREIREGTNNGMGLLVSAWGNNVHPIISEALGIKFTGSRPMSLDARTMKLDESPVSGAQELTVFSRVLKAELNGGEAVGLVDGDSGKKGNPSSPIPAVVLNDYGKGRGVFAAFDLLGSAELANSAEYSALMRSMILHIAPLEANAGAHSIVLLKTSLTVHGQALDIKAVESFSEGFVYMPLFDLNYGTLEFTVSLEDGQTASYTYFARLPDKSEGIKTTDILINVNGSYEEFDSYDHVFALDDSQTLLGKAEAWLTAKLSQYPGEADRINEVISKLVLLEGMPLDTKNDVDTACKTAASAIQEAMGLSFEVTELRAMLDEYLRIIEVYYVLTGEATTIVSQTGTSNNVTVVEISGGETAPVSQAVAGPAITLQKTVADYPRVLVWLNDGCADGNQNGYCTGRDLLASALEGIAYNLVESVADFERELGSDIYTDYMIFGEAEQLGAVSALVLRERVFSGRGLLGSFWIGAYPDELFGITGVSQNVMNDGTVEFIQSDVYAPQTVESRGGVLGIDIANAQDAVAYAGSDIAAHKSQYGLGRTLFYAFDLGLSITDSNAVQMGQIISDSINYLHQEEAAGIYPYKVVPVKTSLQSPADADVSLSESYTDGIVLIDSTGAAIADNPYVLNLHLVAGETKDIYLYATAPDVVGTYQLVAEADGTSASVELVQSRTAVDIANDIIDGLGALNVKGKDKTLINDARKLISDVRDRNIQQTADIEQNVADILSAIELITNFSGADIDALRLEMDGLLGVWQAQWHMAKN